MGKNQHNTTINNKNLTSLTEDDLKNVSRKCLVYNVKKRGLDDKMNDPNKNYFKKELLEILQEYLEDDENEKTLDTTIHAPNKSFSSAYDKLGKYTTGKEIVMNADGTCTLKTDLHDPDGSDEEDSEDSEPPKTSTPKKDPKKKNKEKKEKNESKISDFETLQTKMLEQMKGMFDQLKVETLSKSSASSNSGTSTPNNYNCGKRITLLIL